MILLFPVVNTAPPVLCVMWSVCTSLFAFTFTLRQALMSVELKDFNDFWMFVVRYHMNRRYCSTDRPKKKWRYSFTSARLFTCKSFHKHFTVVLQKLLTSCPTIQILLFTQSPPTIPVNVSCTPPSNPHTPPVTSPLLTITFCHLHLAVGTTPEATETFIAPLLEPSCYHTSFPSF